jgi:hypothetical protein
MTLRKWKSTDWAATAGAGLSALALAELYLIGALGAENALKTLALYVTCFMWPLAWGFGMGFGIAALRTSRQSARPQWVQLLSASAPLLSGVSVAMICGVVMQILNSE